MTKRKITQDTRGLAPIVYIVVLGAIAIGAVGAYSYFQDPDVTYQVAEGGLFNIAGLEIGTLEALMVVVGVVFLAFIWLNSRKGTGN